MNIYAEAIAVLGPESRHKKLSEEAAELSAATFHFLDGKIAIEKWAEEVAGIEMLCEQMRLLHGDAVIDQAKTRQLLKLRMALDEAKRNA